jgi:hypothetical protein
VEDEETRQLLSTLLAPARSEKALEFCGIQITWGGQPANEAPAY